MTKGSRKASVLGPLCDEDTEPHYAKRGTAKKRPSITNPLADRLVASCNLLKKVEQDAEAAKDQVREAFWACVADTAVREKRRVTSVDLIGEVASVLLKVQLRATGRYLTDDDMPTLNAAGITAVKKVLVKEYIKLKPEFEEKLAEDPAKAGSFIHWCEENFPGETLFSHHAEESRQEVTLETFEQAVQKVKDVEQMIGVLKILLTLSVTPQTLKDVSGVPVEDLFAVYLKTAHDPAAAITAQPAETTAAESATPAGRENPAPAQPVPATAKPAQRRTEQPAARSRKGSPRPVAKPAPPKPAEAAPEVAPKAVAAPEAAD
jgi:hypothetical protein